MTWRLRLALKITDWLFLAYWSVSALKAVGLIHVPASWFYAHADESRVVAWNWSFFPLDAAFSLTGLAALSCERKQHPLWRPLAIISLALTMAAGGMAVSYWGLLGEFDLMWFLPNLALVLWPPVFLARLVRESR